jgi:hypothetical protein
MFRITRKSIVSVLVAAVAGALVAVAGSFAVSGNAAAAALKPGQRQPQPAAGYLGKASLDDTGVLSLDVSQVLAGRGTQTLLVDREARLLTGPATRITNRQGARVARALLEDAIVRVHGRLLPISAWPLNDEGQRQPTIRATQITVLQLEAPETDNENETSQDSTDTANHD